MVDRSGGRPTLTSPTTGRVYPLRALWQLDLPTYEPGAATCPRCAAGDAGLRPGEHRDRRLTAPMDRRHPAACSSGIARRRSSSSSAARRAFLLGGHRQRRPRGRRAGCRSPASSSPSTRPAWPRSAASPCARTTGELLDVPPRSASRTGRSSRPATSPSTRRRPSRSASAIAREGGVARRDPARGRAGAGLAGARRVRTSAIAASSSSSLKIEHRSSRHDPVAVDDEDPRLGQRGPTPSVAGAGMRLAGRRS